MFDTNLYVISQTWPTKEVWASWFIKTSKQSLFSTIYHDVYRSKAMARDYFLSVADKGRSQRDNVLYMKILYDRLKN